MWVTFEVPEEVFELVELLLTEHHIAARVLITYGFSVLRNEGLDHDIDDLDFCDRVKPFISVLLFFLERLVEVIKILHDILCVDPDQRFALVLCNRVLEIGLLEVLVVDRKILGTDPLRSAIVHDGLGVFRQSHRAVTLNHGLDRLPVDLLAHAASVDHVSEGDA